MMTLEEKAQAHADKILPVIIDKYQAAPWPEFRDALAQIYIAGAKDAAISQMEEQYSIVPKEFIRRRYEIAKTTYDLYTSATCINEMESRAIDHVEGRMWELNALFGSQLFEAER